MQSFEINKIKRYIGPDLWHQFVIDIVSGMNSYVLVNKYGISLWNATIAKKYKDILALSILKKKNKPAIILRLKSFNVA